MEMHGVVVIFTGLGLLSELEEEQERTRRDPGFYSRVLRHSLAQLTANHFNPTLFLPIQENITFWDDWVARAFLLESSPLATTCLNESLL